MKSTLNIHWKDWCWSWSSSTLETWCKEPTHWKRPWYWERLREEKGVTEDEMAEWHHWLNGHEFEQTLGNSEGQGSLTCYSPLGSQGVGHDLATEQQQEHNQNSLSWLDSKKLNYKVRIVLTLVKWLSLIKLNFNKFLLVVREIMIG